jgi:hypothetical protein
MQRKIKKREVKIEISFQLKRGYVLKIIRKASIMSGDIIISFIIVFISMYIVVRKGGSTKFFYSST